MKQASRLSWHQKFCYYAENRVLTGSAVFGSFFFAGVAQLRHDPEEWEQGAEGYGRRVGTRYAQGLAKSTAEFLVGAFNREDPRPRPPVNMDAFDPRTVKSRLGSALLRTIWTHRDTGHDGIAFSRIAGALSSGFVGNAWYPDRLATTRQALARTGSAFSGYVINNMFSEFQPEVFRAIRKMIGLSPKQPSKTAHYLVQRLSHIGAGNSNGCVRKKVDRWNDTPYWATRMPAEIVPDHGTIFRPEFRRLLEMFLPERTEAPRTLDRIALPEPTSLQLNLSSKIQEKRRELEAAWARHKNEKEGQDALTEARAILSKLKVPGPCTENADSVFRLLRHKIEDIVTDPSKVMQMTEAMGIKSAQ